MRFSVFTAENRMVGLAEVRNICNTGNEMWKKNFFSKEVKIVHGGLSKEVKIVHGGLSKEVKIVHGGLSKEVKIVHGGLSK